jgi:hypothetical protein
MAKALPSSKLHRKDGNAEHPQYEQYSKPGFHLRYRPAQQYVHLVSARDPFRLHQVKRAAFSDDVCSAKIGRHKTADIN